MINTIIEEPSESLTTWRRSAFSHLTPKAILESLERAESRGEYDNMRSQIERLSSRILSEGSAEELSMLSRLQERLAAK